MVTPERFWAVHVIWMVQTMVIKTQRKNYDLEPLLLKLNQVGLCFLYTAFMVFPEIFLVYFKEAEE